MECSGPVLASEVAFGQWTRARGIRATVTLASCVTCGPCVSIESLWVVIPGTPASRGQEPPPRPWVDSGGDMSMPQGGESGQPRETGQVGAPDQQWQGGVPSQGNPSVPGQASAPDQGQYQYGAPPQGGGPGQQWGNPMASQPISPVNEIETRVTGRRIVQYIIDIIIYGFIGWLLQIALNRGTGGVHAVLVAVEVVLIVAWYVIYWALIPFRSDGQTLGMRVMGIRIINLNGGPASMMQLVVRSILLVLFPFVSALVGFIVMMCSRYRQRTGDHMARTIVVRDRVQPMPARQDYVGAQRAG